MRRSVQRRTVAIAARIGRRHSKWGAELVRGQAAPDGPLMDDPGSVGVFSEVGPAETFLVHGQRVVLFDANGDPLTRKVGF